MSVTLALRRRLKQDRCFEPEVSLGFLVKSCHPVSKNQNKMKTKISPWFLEVSELSFLETTFPTHSSKFKAKLENVVCQMAVQAEDLCPAHFSAHRLEPAVLKTQLRTVSIHMFRAAKA